ncbi:MAG: methyltransferase domain-containing protein [Alphaproteobacteria bacterium]|nr:methyltransferase domain-containing protein [Alphaproteobacteria bacterium]
MKSISKEKILLLCLYFTLIFAIGATVIPIIESKRVMEMSDKERFSEIYRSQSWGGWKGVGPGSTIKDGAEPFLNFLQTFLNTHNDISSIVDIGCGYGELLKNITWPKNSRYLGLDIVDSVIKYNKEHYIKDNIEFATVDNVKSLAQFNGDLLIIKDVIQHWSIQKVLFARDHIIPHFKYAIIVNNIRTSFSTVKNSDILTGSSRPLDLEIAPFFMKPALVKDYYLPPYRVKRIYLFVNKDFYHWN